MHCDCTSDCDESLRRQSGRVQQGVCEQERNFPAAERNPLLHAVEKLEAFGPQLGFPHSSAVQGFSGLRELRPRAGRSPWRALYQRVEDVFVIAAIGPEA
ncbi:MAG: type II toxin-antitoxin system RelE/ParE family toxin [Actinomycetales bacterium]|nr:type II toxin-antitoxin system RelE/ParE family toxin [Actinomycetales bacterium]